jgi:hypothetical protein
VEYLYVHTHLFSYINEYSNGDVQLMSFASSSTIDWSISSPALKNLIVKLRNSTVANKMNLRFSMTAVRKRDPNSKDPAVVHMFENEVVGIDRARIIVCSVARCTITAKNCGCFGQPRQYGGDSICRTRLLGDSRSR